MIQATSHLAVVAPKVRVRRACSACALAVGWGLALGLDTLQPFLNKVCWAAACTLVCCLDNVLPYPPDHMHTAPL